METFNYLIANRESERVSCVAYVSGQIWSRGLDSFMISLTFLELCCIRCSCNNLKNLLENVVNIDIWRNLIVKQKRGTKTWQKERHLFDLFTTKRWKHQFKKWLQFKQVTISIRVEILLLWINSQKNPTMVGFEPRTIAPNRDMENAATVEPSQYLFKK